MKMKIEKLELDFETLKNFSAEIPNMPLHIDMRINTFVECANHVSKKLYSTLQIWIYS